MLKIISSRALSSLFLIGLLALLSACGGGGSGTSTTTPTTPVTPTPTAAAISLSATSASVMSDNSNVSTVTATVVDASNAAVPNVSVTFSADSGFLSASTVVSDTTGKATVTFSAGNNPTTRTATIVATASGRTSQLPIRISGSTLTLTTSISSLTVGASTASLSIVAKNSGGTVLPGQTITLTQSGTGTATLGATTGTTDASGSFTTTITPTTAGSVTITASGVGETRTTVVTITGVSATAFQITAPAASTTAIGGSLNVPLTFTVAAPSPTTSVTFVSTLGAWAGSGTSIITVTPTSGVATATLTATAAGVANVQVYDTARQTTLSDSRVVSFTASCAAANRITLQSSPSVVAPSAGGTANFSTLLATITDSSGNPVGSCPIAFNIVNPTGGGETVSPVVVLSASVVTSTLSLGQASTTFTAGSLPSGANGVRVRATIVGTSIATATSPSGADAAIVIGGTAGSVTIGASTVIGQDTSATVYILPMSVLVSDSNGNPVANTTVSLSAWPIGFNVNGTNCIGTTYPGNPGTFYFNEDVNENLILDPGEDGVRRNYVTGVVSTGTLDGQLTPPNSAAGTLPATVTTAANGVATFNLTYTKSNAQWIIDRIRARTIVQGTETLGEVKFVLPVLQSDATSCVLAPSPYVF